MPSIYAGIHLPNKPDEFLKIEQIDLDKNVLHLKQQIAEKCQFQAENLEVICDGLQLTDEEKLSEALKPGANTIHTVHCFQKTKKYTPYVPSEKLKDAVDTAQSLFYTIGNIQINVSCRVNILQKILAEYPEFRRNSAALALIRDSVLFNTLHQPEVIKKIAEHYPIIIEAAPFIVSTVRKELARSGSSSKFSEPATDSTNSSEEENSVGSNERGSRDDEGGSSARSQSETARIRMISRHQLQAALAQIGFGSANSLSNIAQRNSETSVAASASETTSTPLSSSASGERISADELQRALDTLNTMNQPMDTTEQQAVNTSVTDDGDIPSALRTHPYAEQLRTMQQMGFLNHEENLNFLNLANGNIEQAVNLLMAAMM
uniref:Ubiquitin n=1 Tax=Musca domestica TaxID=7370 RepID=T1P7Z1_MUSDO